MYECTEIVDDDTSKDDSAVNEQTGAVPTTQIKRIAQLRFESALHLILLYNTI
jgi:hypothetical protein